MNGLNTRQTEVFWICFAVAAVDGFDTLSISFIAPELARDWALSGVALGRIFAAGLFGAAIGGVLAGPLADRIGRKRVLLGSVALVALFTLACAMATGPAQLLSFRIVAGLGLGGAIPTITALMAESTPPERRSSIVTRMFLGFPIGAVGGGLLCAAMVGSLGWRSAFWLGGFLALALLPVLWRRIDETLAAPNASAPRRSALTQIVEPLRGGRAVAGICLWLAAFNVLLVSYFLINWTPTILFRAGIANEHAILGGVILNLGGVAGAVALTFVIDRIGPFRTVALALFAGALLVAAFGKLIDIRILVAPLIFIVGMAVIGGQLNLPAMAAALFPADTRATGVGWTMAIGRAGSIVGPYVGGVMVDARLDWPELFLLVSIPTALAGFLLWLVGYLGSKRTESSSAGVDAAGASAFKRQQARSLSSAEKPDR